MLGAYTPKSTCEKTENLVRLVLLSLHGFQRLNLSHQACTANTILTELLDINGILIYPWKILLHWYARFHSMNSFNVLLLNCWHLGCLLLWTVHLWAFLYTNFSKQRDMFLWVHIICILLSYIFPKKWYYFAIWLFYSNLE